MKKKLTTRSENMARIKSSNTKPELFIRKLMYRHGYRYRVNYERVPGKPDIFMNKHNTAIFVNGCFWHMHQNCKRAVMPKTNTEYWQKKLMRNTERDRRNYKKINDLGFQVIVVWECTVKKFLKKDADLDILFQQIENAVKSDCIFTEL